MDIWRDATGSKSGANYFIMLDKNVRTFIQQLGFNYKILAPGLKIGLPGRVRAARGSLSLIGTLTTTNRLAGNTIIELAMCAQVKLESDHKKSW